MAVLAAACGSTEEPPPSQPPPLDFQSTSMRLTLVKAEDDRGNRIDQGIGGLTLFLKAKTASRDGKLRFDKGSAEVVVGDQPGASFFLSPFSMGVVKVAQGDTNKPFPATVRSSDDYVPQSLVLTKSVSRRGMAYGQTGFGSEAFEAQALERLEFPVDGIALGGELTGNARLLHPDDTVTRAKLTFRLSRDEEAAKIVLPAAYPDGTYPNWVNPTTSFDKPVTLSGPIMLQIDERTPVEYVSEVGLWSTGGNYPLRLIYPEGVDYAGLPVPARTIDVKPAPIETKAAFNFAVDRPFLSPGAEIKDDPDCEKGRCVVLRGNPAAGQACPMPPHMAFGLEQIKRAGQLYTVRIRLLGQTNKAWKNIFLSRPVPNFSSTFGYDGIGPTAEGAPRSDFPYDSGWLSLDASADGDRTFVFGIFACNPSVKMLVQEAGIRTIGQ